MFLNPSTTYAARLAWSPLVATTMHDGEDAAWITVAYIGWSAVLRVSLDLWPSSFSVDRHRASIATFTDPLCTHPPPATSCSAAAAAADAAPAQHGAVVSRTSLTLTPPTASATSLRLLLSPSLLSASVSLSRTAAAAGWCSDGVVACACDSARFRLASTTVSPSSSLPSLSSLSRLRCRPPSFCSSMTSSSCRSGDGCGHGGARGDGRLPVLLLPAPPHPSAAVVRTAAVVVSALVEWSGAVERGGVPSRRSSELARCAHPRPGYHQPVRNSSCCQRAAGRAELCLRCRCSAGAALLPWGRPRRSSTAGAFVRWPAWGSWSDWRG